MNWDVKLLKTPEQHAAGVLAFPSPLPLNMLLLFCQIAPGSVIHTRGVQEPLNIFVLNASFREIFMTTLNPDQVLTLPEGAAHVVEMSVRAAPPPNFKMLLWYTW